MRDELIAIVANLMQQQQLVMDNMDIYSDEELLQFQQDFQQQIMQITQTLDVIEAQEASQETISTQMIPEEADLLWILSGGNPEAFASYVQTFPSNQLQRYKDNPQALQMLVGTLQNRLPQDRQGEQDGVPKAPAQSSTIYGFQYDPKSKKLRVRFNEGGVYEYEGVPPQIYSIFERGAIPAKTAGSNRWGRWWVGKRDPSYGASFHSLIKLGGYPYEKIS